MVIYRSSRGILAAILTLYLIALIGNILNCVLLFVFYKSDEDVCET